MSKAEEKLQDPSIPKDNKGIVVWTMCSMTFTTLAYILSITWMISTVEIVVWLMALLSVAVIASWMFLPRKEVHKTVVTHRIPLPLLYGTTAAKTAVLTILATQPHIPILYFFGCAVLSINYTLLLEQKDKAYTEKIMNKGHKTSVVMDFFDKLRKSVDERELRDKKGSKTKRPKSYWDTDDEE